MTPVFEMPKIPSLSFGHPVEPGVGSPVPTSFVTTESFKESGRKRCFILVSNEYASIFYVFSSVQTKSGVVRQESYEEEGSRR